MEERRNRTPKKPEHPIREWISDYLRYFMLAGAIILILLVIFIAVRLISGRTGDQTAESTAESAVTAVSELPDAEDTDHLAETEESTEAVSTSEAEEAAETEAAETAEETASAELTKEADASVIAGLVNTYFQGLAAADPETVRSCVDTLSDEDYQSVAENTAVTSYTDVEVYTSAGTDDTSRAVYVSYKYTVSGSDVEIPGLTQFYAYDTGDGDWRLASDTSGETIQARFQELAQTEEVQNLISQVQAAYDQVMAEHPELQ